VTARPESGRAPGARAQPDGRFVLQGLEPGTYRVFATLVDGGNHLSDPAEGRDEKVVSATAADVRLTVRLGAVLEVAVTPSPRRGDSLTLLADAERRSPRHLDVPNDGRVRVRRLDEDTTYTLWSPPNADGYLLARGVRAPGSVSLRRERGAAIRVRLSGEALDGPLGVRAEQGPLTVHGKALPDGTFELADLPPGRWTVHAWASDATRSRPDRKASVEAAPGTTIDLVIPPAAR
jgi:hypothetical protein